MLDASVGDSDLNAGSDATNVDVLAGLLLRFGLTGVPVPVSLSLLALSGWLVSYYAVHFLFAPIPPGALRWLAGLVLLVPTFLAAAWITARLIRPLRPLFRHGRSHRPDAHRHRNRHLLPRPRRARDPVQGVLLQGRAGHRADRQRHELAPEGALHRCPRLPDPLQEGADEDLPNHARGGSTRQGRADLRRQHARGHRRRVPPAGERDGRRRPEGRQVHRREPRVRSRGGEPPVQREVLRGAEDGRQADRLRAAVREPSALPREGHRGHRRRPERLRAGGRRDRLPRADTDRARSTRRTSSMPRASARSPS